MYVVRNVFKTKPGKARQLVDKFLAANKLLDETKIWGVRLMTDTVSTFWTVVLEFEVAELDDYFHAMEERAADPRWREAMSGYMDLVDGGHREIYSVETAWTKSELTVGG